MLALIEQLQLFLSKFKYHPAKNSLKYILGSMLVFDFFLLGKLGHVNYLVGIIKDILKVMPIGFDMNIALIIILIFVMLKKERKDGV